MRFKLIAVFSVVVLIVGGVSYALTRAVVAKEAAANPDDTPRALAAALAQLRVDGVSAERWLAEQAVVPSAGAPFAAGTSKARSEKATEEANRIHNAAGAAGELGGAKPSVIFFVDTQGIVLGRNGSALMRNDDLSKVYPKLVESMNKGLPGTALWVNKERNEQLMTTYAPVRNSDGAVVGALVMGMAFNDERLAVASDKTSGKHLVAAHHRGDKLEIIARTPGTPDALVQNIESDSQRLVGALGSGSTVDLSGLPNGLAAEGRSLDTFTRGTEVMLVAATAAGGGLIDSLLWPALGVTLLGLALVAIFGVLLDNYISKPISEMEDGMLAIMNGKTDLRFEIEHAELGGLVFRINSLLNLLLGVQEDDTDEQGRPSHAPTSRAFTEALAVDERIAVSGETAADANSLHDEPSDAYYERIYGEYVAGKKSIGDPVDHITRVAFVQRIQASEQELATKHGKPVRFRVEVQGTQVNLLAVPLPS